LRGDASDKVLYSACFGAGFVGSKLLDNFDRIMVRDFLGKKDDEVNRQTVRPPNSP
jgi:hypothetical protein